MNKRTMRLCGAASEDLRVPADVLVEVVASLVEGARQATRFFVEGQSTRKGTRPSWLDAACGFEVTGLTPGSVVIGLAAPTLAEADPSRFGSEGQVAMFADPLRVLEPGVTAIDLFADVLDNAIHGEPDRVMVDRALLDTCLRFARATRGRFGAVELQGIAGRSKPLVVSPEHIAHLELLRDDTPPPRAVRVAGRLDTITASKASIVLVLADNSTVSARLDAELVEGIKHLFNTKVVVSGMAQFRPSGKLLTIDVEHIGAARPEDAVFEQPPRGQLRLVPTPAMRQDQSTGVSAFFATWPGEESDEELLAALEAIR